MSESEKAAVKHWECMMDILTLHTPEKIFKLAFQLGVAWATKDLPTIPNFPLPNLNILKGLKVGDRVTINDSRFMDYEGTILTIIENGSMLVGIDNYRDSIWFHCSQLEKID